MTPLTPLQEKATWDSWVTTPRWWPTRETLHNVAKTCGVDFEFKGAEIGIIRKTVYFKFSGSRSRVEAVKRFITKWVNED